ncbi:ABC transporter ATP-binding protein [Actinomadura darangshiensis]|uniref:ABC transporter ATP-binding protein n=1 Tax=Actinomadura darangshiensis TaxID=705336 RepID=A0A4R5AUE4_9ACTN|nr:ABC transporter ATP-binding protein [Actinomadura darangshiensis]TDD75660.1 ABC transporter ATP-binding protein [Actinomadura darangshiensis]
MTSALETTDLGKRYGRDWGLRGCSLRVPVGSVAALVGPNGAGKSTLLHLAVGLLKPDEGEVRVFGKAPGDSRELLEQVGFVAQDTPLYPDFTVAELVKLGSKLNRTWDDDLAVDRLGKLDIPLDRKAGRLSGGQRAQVALVLAIAKRPRLLLLDEPVAALDPLARREFMQALMGIVADQGTTVLHSSHLLGDVERTCDWLVVVRKGSAQVVGSVDELLAEHRTLIGPRTREGEYSGVGTVLRESHTDKQTTLLVRTGGPIHHPAWNVSDVTLEDLVLAYLADPNAAALPGPVSLPQRGVGA